MGKWDFLKGQYPKLPLDAEYQAKLDFVLDQPPSGDPEQCVALGASRYRDLGDSGLLAEYLKVRDELDSIAARSSVLNVVEEAFTREFMRRFEAGDTVGMSFENGVSLGVSQEPYPVVKDKDALRGWVKDKGLEAMLSLNYQTLASLVKERLEGKVREPLPSGVDVFIKDKLSCRGRNKK